MQTLALRRMNMWKLTNIETEKSYVILLCQSNETKRRFCRIAAVEYDSNNEKDVVFKTEVIPNELIEKYQWKEIQEQYRLLNGSKFGFGPHGEWFTEKESKSLRAHALGEAKVIEWETEEPPCLPPA